MSERSMPAMTGGCQCGAVRYALASIPPNFSICHCRMCQKAFGSLFAPLASVPLSDLTWTRGAPSIFRSSELVERGFCNACGTPLTFRYMDEDEIAMSVGSLDEPERVPPTIQYGREARLSCFDRLHTLPARTTDQVEPSERMAKLASLQHPDHDTETWPPRG